MTTAPRFLALDLGTKCGWAMAEGDKIIGSGVRDFSTKRHQHIGHRGVMFHNFLKDLGRFDEIYYERILFTGSRPGGGAWMGASQELYHGLSMIMHMWSATLGIPAIGVWPGTLKKAFTGHGMAEKADMCRRAHELGWQGGARGTAECNDEADAIALLFTQMHEHHHIQVRF